MAGQREFIDRVKKSGIFARSSQLQELLEFLFVQTAAIAAKELDTIHFKFEGKNVGDHAKERVNSLKVLLLQYQQKHPDEPWRIEIPDARAAGGYRLTLIPNAREESGQAAAFWQPHLASPNPCRIVCDPVLFFYDHSMPGVFRYADTNVDVPNRDAALADLKGRHKTAFKKNLIPEHLYVDVGAVRASETLREFFARRLNHPVSLLMSTDHTPDVYLNVSPIFLGVPRTNFFLRRFFESEDAEGLSFRVSATYPAVEVIRPTGDDLRTLSPLGLKLDQEGNGFLLTPSKERTLAIVTRAPLPGQSGVMTMIMSDATLAVAKLAAVLTNDKSLTQLIRKTGWAQGKPFPQTMEMLFQVNLWPGNIENAAGEPQLLAWRPAKASK